MKDSIITRQDIIDAIMELPAIKDVRVVEDCFPTPVVTVTIIRKRFLFFPLISKKSIEEQTFGIGDRVPLGVDFQWIIK
jgi:hypothetical protein